MFKNKVEDKIMKEKKEKMKKGQKKNDMNCREGWKAMRQLNSKRHER